MKFLKVQNRNAFGKLFPDKDKENGVNQDDNDKVEEEEGVDRQVVDSSELFAEPMTLEACRCFHVLDKVLPKYLSTTSPSVIHQMHFEQFMDSNEHLMDNYDDDDDDYDDDDNDDDIEDDEEGAETKNPREEKEVDENEDGDENMADENDDDDQNDEDKDGDDGDEEEDKKVMEKKSPAPVPSSSLVDGRVLRKRRGTSPYPGMVPSSCISAGGQWKPPSSFLKETVPKPSAVSSGDKKDSLKTDKDNDAQVNQDDGGGDDNDDDEPAFASLEDTAIDLIYPQIKGIKQKASHPSNKRKQADSPAKNGIPKTSEKKTKNQLSDDRYHELRQAEMDLKQDGLSRMQAQKINGLFGLATAEEEEDGGGGEPDGVNNGDKDKADSEKNTSSRKQERRRDAFLRRLRRRRQKQEQNEDYILASCVEEWLEVFRRSRVGYWQRRRRQRLFPNKSKGDVSMFGSSFSQTSSLSSLCCQWCPSSQVTEDDDNLMQCLECSAIGCGPGCINPQSKQHIMLHFLSSGHSLGVTLGARGELFCLYCGDFVYHQVFDQERERIDIMHTVPWLGWRESTVQRSLDPLVFVQSPAGSSGGGVLWRGMVAKYPLVVPDELRQAALLSKHRVELFRGTVAASSIIWGPQATAFALQQRKKCDLALANGNQKDGWKIGAPVGMYNMGNTCYINCVLQCLVNCVELQRHFLHDVRHCHEACQVLRKSPEGQQVAAEARRKRLEKEGETVSQPQSPSFSRRNNNNSDAKKASDKDAEHVCLACEMDRLLLQYYSSAIGMDISAVLAEAPTPAAPYMGSSSSFGQGQPLVLSNLLTVLWKCRGMRHLAGYEQRDAHEFLQAFLDIMGKHASHYQEIADTMAEYAVPARERPADGSRTVNKSKRANVVKHLFEGTLRSNLICSTCGHKRSQPEPFLNISLPLAKEMERSVAIDANSPSTGIGTRKNIASKMKISVRLCLEHFTKPEKLMDSVQCPECRTKTPHRKQHTFAKLPKILCLHLKRFDAATNRKISDPVSFPAHGLDMGPLLPHWCEEIPGASDGDNDDEDDTATNSIKRELTRAELIQKKRLEGTLPKVLYDLVGTVNHSGTLNQGHYVSNVKIDHQWYHCNDTQVFPLGPAAAGSGTTTTTATATANNSTGAAGGGTGTAGASGNKVGGSGEQEVLQSDGAYILFYRRRTFEQC